jgi:biotin carboxylase
MKWMCSFKEGTLARYNPDDMAELLAMESYRGHQWFIAPGGHLPKTRNCFSWTGCVRLVNDTKEGLQRDWDRIEAMQSTTLYELDTTEPLPPPAPKSCVVVVDPFSTGAMVAYNATLMGYRCIAAYSAELEQLDALTSLIPQGIPLVFDAIVGYSSDIATMAEEIKKNGWEILAVLAGAETGVELADKLSEHMGLRTNGTALSEARRNKFIMGETVRAAGIRAVKQLYATKWGEISEFLSDWNPDPFKVIVKPVDSAGSEDVTLCLSVDDVKGAFDKIIGKVNGLGIVNKAVLVQEYLEGTEYVIDIVSRDGEHKVVAIWEYERRVCNGASFVCFSQRLLTADEPRCRELMDYQRRVVTALGIRHGPTHGEVKWFKDEPVLVEVGARCHGMEGIWAPLADRIYGYNQINATLYAYLDKDAFDRLPAEVCNIF